MDELLHRLRAGLPARYAVDREVGRGCMAVVFLARDTKHDRPVALKTLRPELAASLGPERLLFEIQVAARLQLADARPVRLRYRQTAKMLPMITSETS